MARKLDPAIVEVLKKHGIGAEACWDCHGTWVVYHRYLEQVAAQAGIHFDAPQIIEANSAEKIVAICVTGHLDKGSAWSIGEAAPGNNKNSYPYAMAEKRAKDRVILKLIGLHGLVYSEEEADDFKVKTKTGEEAGGPLKKTELKEKLRDFCGDLPKCGDADELNALVTSHKGILEQGDRDLPAWMWGKEGSDNQGIRVRITEATDRLNQMEPFTQ